MNRCVGTPRNDTKETKRKTAELRERREALRYKGASTQAKACARQSGVEPPFGCAQDDNIKAGRCLRPFLRQDEQAGFAALPSTALRASRMTT
jgi:hypothetical protein